MSTRRGRRRRELVLGLIVLALAGGLYWASKSGALAVALLWFSDVAGHWVSSLFFPGAQ